MTLRYLASQETVYEISDRFGVTEMAFLRHKQAIISAINKYLFKRFITWPRNDEMDNIAGEFNDMGAYFFPNIIGAIDGTHIQIEPNVANPQAYFNRKKFFPLFCRLFVRRTCISQVLMSVGLEGYMMRKCFVIHNCGKLASQDARMDTIIF